MKERMKNQKGITLIALIITIVVLLILAVVAINSIRNDGIISHAGNVANRYNEAVENEQQHLQNYLDYLDKVNGGSTATWTQTGTSVTNGKVTLEVGTTVTGYTSPTGTTDPGWAVLGAENGKLLLVSKTNVQSSVELSGTTHLVDTNNNGKEDGIDLLDSICASYLNTSLADSARSITVEDINRVTGYNPETAAYGSGNVWAYGNEVTYTMNASGKVLYNGTESSYTTFTMPNGTDLKNVSEGIKVTSDAYYYYPNTLTTNSSGDTNGIATNSKAYSVLFSNTDWGNGSYWLASPCADTYAGYAHFGLRAVYDSGVSFYYLWDSYHGSNSGSGYGARAVVSLQSDVNIDSNGQIS